MSLAIVDTTALENMIAGLATIESGLVDASGLVDKATGDALVARPESDPMFWEEVVNDDDGTVLRFRRYIPEDYYPYFYSASIVAWQQFRAENEPILRRVLGLAYDMQAQSVGNWSGGVGSIDDGMLEGGFDSCVMSTQQAWLPGEMGDRGAAVGAQVAAGVTLSDEDWANWLRFSGNLVFASGLMANCTLEQLAAFTAATSRQYGASAQAGVPVPPDWGKRLQAMQTSFNLWVNSLPYTADIGQDIIRVLQNAGVSGSASMDGSVGMSLLLGGCAFSTDLTLAITEAMYQWSLTHPNPFPGVPNTGLTPVSAPNLYVYANGSSVYNTLVGVISLLANNQAASTQFFKGASTAPPDRVSWAVVTDWGDGGQAAARALTAADAFNPNLPWVKQMLPPGLAVVPPDPLVVVKLGHAFAASGSLSPDTTFLNLALLATAMVNNCPEPYQRLFLEHLDDLRVVDIDPGDWPMTWPVTGTINVDVDGLLNNVPSPLWTFFHEYGHLIDQSSRTPGYDSPDFTYPDASGTPRTLAWWLKQDLISNLTDILAHHPFNPPINPAQKLMVYFAIMDHDTKHLRGWIDFDAGTATPGTPAAAFMQVQNYYSQSSVLNNATSRTAADVYGGLTGNAISGPFYAHRKSYWRAPPPWPPPEVEFWANYFADQMTDKTQQIATGSSTATSLYATQQTYFHGASIAVQAFADSLP